jgi:hypothetical protein
LAKRKYVTGAYINKWKTAQKDQDDLARLYRESKTLIEIKNPGPKVWDAVIHRNKRRYNFTVRDLEYPNIFWNVSNRKLRVLTKMYKCNWTWGWIVETIEFQPLDWIKEISIPVIDIDKEVWENQQEILKLKQEMKNTQYKIKDYKYAINKLRASKMKVLAESSRKFGESLK